MNATHLVTMVTPCNGRDQRRLFSEQQRRELVKSRFNLPEDRRRERLIYVLSFICPIISDKVEKTGPLRSVSAPLRSLLEQMGAFWWQRLGHAVN